MLEYNFNELDNDFITLWSHYCLYHDTAAIINPLRQLAHKGQINAIQCWYLLKKDDEQDEVIDKIVDSFYGDSFNEALAIANKIYAANKKQINDLKDLIIENNAAGLDLKRDYYRRNEDLKDSANKYYIKRDTYLQELRKTTWGQQYTKAADLTRLASLSTRTCLVYERLFELWTAEPLITRVWEIPRKNIVHERKFFIERLKKNDKDYPALFSLGKNYFLFSKEPKEQYKGTEILRKLAERKLTACKYDNEKEGSL